MPEYRALQKAIFIVDEKPRVMEDKGNGMPILY